MGMTLMTSRTRIEEVPSDSYIGEFCFLDTDTSLVVGYATGMKVLYKNCNQLSIDVRWGIHRAKSSESNVERRFVLVPTAALSSGRLI